MTREQARTVIGWTLSAPCAGWALLRLSGIDPFYPLAPALSYTPYVAAVAVAAALIAALLRQWIAASVSAIAVVVLILLIVSRVLGGPDTEVNGREVRVMSANLHFGHGDPEVLLHNAQERDVEILAVQEMSSEFAQSFEELGGRRFFPYAVLDIGETVSGNGVYSRYPLERIDRPGEEVARLRTEVSRGGFVIEVSSVHTRPPRGSSSLEGWEEGLDSLPDAGAEGPPVFLLGDFNATFDHSKFRDLVNRGYEDAAEQMGDGLKTTWPTRETPLRYLPVTIDHLLYEESGGTRAYEVLDLPGSDHRTLYGEIVIPAGP